MTQRTKEWSKMNIILGVCEYVFSFFKFLFYLTTVTPAPLHTFTMGVLHMCLVHMQLLDGIMVLTGRAEPMRSKVGLYSHNKEVS